MRLANVVYTVIMFYQKMDGDRLDFGRLANTCVAPITQLHSYIMKNDPNKLELPTQ